MHASAELDARLQYPPELDTLSPAVHGRFVEEESFRLPDMWMLHFYDYHGRLSGPTTTYRIQPGSASLTPANIPIHFSYEGVSAHIYAHFRLPDLTLPEAPEPNILFWEPDPRVSSFRELLSGALYFQAMDTRRASARLWEVLLGLASLLRMPDFRSEEDRILETALHIFNAGMAAPAPLRIADVARRTGVSINTLERTFRRRLDITPSAYLRQCRVKRAVELLTHSNLPIKAIACAVGLPDLQHFNKSLRRETNRSPREWRTLNPAGAGR